MKFTTVIFDLDGTVLENEQVYARAFEDILKKYKIDVNENGFSHSRGIGLEANWEHLVKEYKISEKITINQLVHETQDAYHSRMDEVLVREGFFDFHNALKEEGVVTALATSNNWWMVEDELEDLRLSKYFDFITTGEEAAFKKPSPDIFLVCAKKVEVEPEECVVIEDSQAGIFAANEAGMKAIAIINFFSKEEDFPTADLVVSSFDDLNPQVLDSLF